MRSGNEAEELEFLNDLLHINSSDIFDQTTGLTTTQIDEFLEGENQYPNLNDAVLKEIHVEEEETLNSSPHQRTADWVLGCSLACLLACLPACLLTCLRAC